MLESGVLRHPLWTMGVILIFFASDATAETKIDSAVEPSPQAILSVRMAVERAYAYTGFTRDTSSCDSGATDTAFLLTMDEKETPFLWGYVTGRRVWDVKLKAVTLYLPKWTPSFVKMQLPQDWEAWIDSATGVLFKIERRLRWHDPDLAPEPPADIATKMMSDGEEWVAFPVSLPVTSFIEALDAADGADPFSAKEIVAWYVMFSHLGKPPIPTWQIIGRGIAPHEIHPRPKRPMYLRNRMRSIVNADTGEEIMITNSPAVLHREEEKPQ